TRVQDPINRSSKTGAAKILAEVRTLGSRMTRIFVAGDNHTHSATYKDEGLARCRAKAVRGIGPIRAKP
ncbi:MAG: hypothetical protein O9352_05100, partial [Rhizobium sp.]|nr:hypothetical protein [Rhizobium sp.]